MNTATKGIVLALLASAVISTANVSAQHFMKFTNAESLAAVWYIPTVVAAVLITALKGRLLSEIKSHWKQGIAIGAIYSFAAIFWFKSISLIGAERAGFVTRFETVFAVLLAVIFLKEKLNRKEAFGIFVAVAGTLIISYSGSNYIRIGSLIALLAALAIALHLLVARVLLKTVDKVTMLGFRNFFTSLFLAAYVLMTGTFKPIPLATLPFIAFFSLLSSFAGFYILFMALDHLGAAKTGAFRVLDPVFIVIYASLIFGSSPGAQSIIGGAVTLAGILILSLSREKPAL